MDRIKKIVKKSFDYWISYSSDFGYNRDLRVQYNRDYTFSIFEKNNTIALKVCITKIKKTLFELLKEGDD